MDDRSTTTVRLLNLSYLSPEDWRHWTEASGAAHWQSCSGDTPAALDEIATALGGRVVVLHSEPEQAVWAAIEAGQSPQKALYRWHEQATALRAALRRHRRSCYLIEARQLLEGDQESLCAALSDWTGKTLIAPARRDSARDPLYDVLALQAVQLMPSIGRLRDELRAAGFAPAPQAEAETQAARLAEAALDLQNSGTRVRQTQEEAAALEEKVTYLTDRLELMEADLTAEQHLAEQEMALAQQSIHALQMSLEVEVGAHGALQKRFTHLSEQELPSLLAELSKARRAAMESESARLEQRAQLHDSQQQRVALAEELHSLKLELDRRQQDITALLNSTSWQATAPLRALRLTLSRRNR